MSLASDELWQRMLRMGVATDEQCRQWSNESLTKLSESDAKNGLKLLLHLVAAGHLTKYQAKIIAGQSSQPIRYGAWLVEHPVKLPLWQGWYQVCRPQQAPRWARPVSAGELQRLRPLRPSLPRALKLATLQLNGIIAVQPPELAGGALLVFAEPPGGPAVPPATGATNAHSSAAPQAIAGAGKLLSQEFSRRRCPPVEATRIVGQVAKILLGLHSQHIVHGRVLPDRIYVHDQRIMLAIDPLCAATGLPQPLAESAQPGLSEHKSNPPQAADSLAFGLLGSALQTAAAARFCAPELHLAEPLPTPASDVYSLGCVWWWLLTGQPPAAAPVDGTQPAPLATAPLRLPADCELPELLWRCLQACLAPNPSSRFASAEQLHQALEVAQRASPIAAEIKSQRAPQAQATPQRQAVRSEPRPTEPPRTRPPAPAAEIPQRRRRRRGIPWLGPILGGSGLLIGLLLLLKFTGALQPSAESPARTAHRPPVVGSSPTVRLPSEVPSIAEDPRSAHFEIVAARPGSNQRGLWAPPNAPAPMPLDLLPPGGQLFLSLRPDQWPALDSPLPISGDSSDAPPVAWSDVLGEQLTSLAQQLQDMSGVPLADIEQVSLSYYAAEQSGQPPRVCGRFHLSRPKPLTELIAGWNEPTSEQVSQRQLWVVNTQRAYYLAGQSPSATGSSAETATASASGTTVGAVSEFSVGPLDMMREVAELDGTPGPLLPHLEKLWNSTDHTAAVSLLVSTPFLFTDGRDLLDYLPPQLRPTLKQWLGGDVRGATLHLHWQPLWYLETRVVGTSDTDAGKILARQQQQVQSLPATVEAWLVSHTVDPYWRALALRYPQMLRTFVDYSRFGVEHGTALMNGYLPSQGGTNLTLTSWIALQDYATLQTTANAVEPPPSSATSDNSATVDIEAYLAQAIRLSFDQEPIEVALQLVADEANSKLPPGVEPLRFVLDGAAFGKAGITRNQQLSDFRIDQQSVRDALTEIARRGNPVTTVTDLRDPDQRLLWVVAPDPDSSRGAWLIWLTTRTAAQASGNALPIEFAPVP